MAEEIDQMQINDFQLTMMLMGMKDKRNVKGPQQDCRYRAGASTTKSNRLIRI